MLGTRQAGPAVAFIAILTAGGVTFPCSLQAHNQLWGCIDLNRLLAGQLSQLLLGDC
jgi:hypothetical protein